MEISAESEKILEFNRDMPNENYLIMRTQDLLKKIESYNM